jgi:hypothetical protein
VQPVTAPIHIPIAAGNRAAAIDIRQDVGAVRDAAAGSRFARLYRIANIRHYKHNMRAKRAQVNAQTIPLAHNVFSFLQTVPLQHGCDMIRNIAQHQRLGR